MKYLLHFFIFLITVAFIAFLVFNYLASPLKPGSVQRGFAINQGDSLSSIALRLEKNGFIRNHYAFMASAYLQNLNHRLRAGNFQLSAALSTPDIIQKLAQGGTREYWLKIIDGSRVEEIAPSFTDTEISPVQFIAQSKSLEGYLFPDSYLIPFDYTIDQVHSLINRNFSTKFAAAQLQATNTGMTDRDIVTFASIIEREARTLESKQMVAGILLNRLHAGMPLQVDATVQYVRDNYIKNGNYWQPLKANDINNISSPFNTYKNTGLTPSPICSPGYNSLYAAFHPTDSDYFFYISDPNGVMHYAKTLDEHNLNIAKYLR